MLSMLSMRAHSLLIVVVLNSWSSNSNIPVMSGGLMLVQRLQLCFLPFCTPCNFFLIVRYNIWVKETAVNGPLVMWW